MNIFLSFLRPSCFYARECKKEVCAFEASLSLSCQLQHIFVYMTHHDLVLANVQALELGLGPPGWAATPAHSHAPRTLHDSPTPTRSFAFTIRTINAQLFTGHSSAHSWSQ
jgi:hypothetical protein